MSAQGASIFVQKGRRLNRDAIPLLYYQKLLLDREALSGQHLYLPHQLIYRCRGLGSSISAAGMIHYLTARHLVLNSRVQSKNGIDFMICHNSCDFQTLDLDVRDDANPEERIRNEIEEFTLQRFDLFREAPVRGISIRVSDEEQIIGILVHHIVADAMSVAIMTRDIMAYFRHAGRLPEQPASLGMTLDYVRSKTVRLEPSKQGRLNSFWQEKIGQPVIQPFLCPSIAGADLNAPVTKTGFDIPFHRRLVAPTLRQEGITPNILFLAAHAYAVRMMTGSAGASVACQISGRMTKESTGLVGCFTDTMPLVTDISGAKTHAELARKVRASYFEGLFNAPPEFAPLLDIFAFRDLRIPRINWYPPSQAVSSSSNRPPVKIPGRGSSVEIQRYPSMLPRTFNTTDRLKEAYYLVAGEVGQSMRGFLVTWFNPGIAIDLLGHIETFLEGILDDADRPLPEWPVRCAAFAVNER